MNTITDLDPSATTYNAGDLVVYYALGTHAVPRAGFVRRVFEDGSVECEAACGAGISAVNGARVMRVHVGMTYRHAFAGFDYRVVEMHAGYILVVRVRDLDGQTYTVNWESLSRVGARWTPSAAMHNVQVSA